MKTLLSHLLAAATLTFALGVSPGIAQMVFKLKAGDIAPLVQGKDQNGPHADASYFWVKRSAIFVSFLPSFLTPFLPS